MGQSLLQKKHYAEAIQAFSKIPQKPFDQGNNGLLMIIYTYALSGDLKTAKALLEKVSEEDRKKCPYFLAYVYLGLGDKSYALSQLEFAFDAHSIILGFLKTDPVWDPIRNETRLKSLLKKTGLE